MPAGSYRQADVNCPFYKEDNCKNRIACEGIIPSTTLSSFYPTRESFGTQMETFCCGAYAKCEIYAALMKNYEEEP